MITEINTIRRPFFLGLDMDEFGNIRVPSPASFRPEFRPPRPPRRIWSTIFKIIIGLAALAGLIHGIMQIDWSGILSGPYLRYLALGDGITYLKQTTSGWMYLICLILVVAAAYGNVFIPKISDEYLPSLNAILALAVMFGGIKGFFYTPETVGNSFYWVLGIGTVFFAGKSFFQGYSWFSTLLYILIGLCLALVAYRASELFFYKSHWFLGGLAFAFMALLTFSVVVIDLGNEWDS